MRVYPMSNENPKFRALKISDTNSWDAKLMQEFVQNAEVQKFVKYWHDKGVDIIASGHGKSGIAMHEDSSKPERFFVGIYSGLDGVRDFNAAKAIAEVVQETKEKIEGLPLIQEAQDFVAKFNRALNINSAWQKAGSAKNDAEFYKAFVDELLGTVKK